MGGLPRLNKNQGIMLNISRLRTACARSQHSVPEIVACGNESVGSPHFDHRGQFYPLYELVL